MYEPRIEKTTELQEFIVLTKQFKDPTGSTLAYYIIHITTIILLKLH